MKENKDENNIMKELSSTIIFTEKSDIKFVEEYLDDKSIYTYVFLNSIYHDNVEELREHLKLQFHSKSKYNISKEEYLSTKDDYFDKSFNELNLREEKNINKEKFKPINLESKENKYLFISSFFIALLSSIFQLSFTYIIIKEYEKEYYIDELNINSKIMRIAVLFCLTFKTFTEFMNGKKIVVYGIYNGFLYKTQIRRMLSILMGLIQIGTNLSILVFFFKLIFIYVKIIKYVEILCIFIVISQFDNMIGGYYINSCQKLKNYCRGVFSQINLVNNRKKCKITFIDIILYIIFIVFVFLSLIHII